MKKVFFHLGPHKTGSSAIQAFFSEKSDQLSSEYSLKFLSGKDLAGTPKAVLDENWPRVRQELALLKSKIEEAPENKALVSSEDFSGHLPGRSGVRRVYPNFGIIVDLILEVFKPHDCQFVFFHRDENDWLRSAYVQNLVHRPKFSSFEKFTQFVEFEQGWSSVIEEPKNKLGDRFALIRYSDDTNFSSIREMLKLLSVSQKSFENSSLTKRDNTSPREEQIRMLEVINRSHSSGYAKQEAKKWLLNKKHYPAKEPPISDEQANWPRDYKSVDVPPLLRALKTRADTRIHYQQDQPWLLPSQEFRFEDSRLNLVEGAEKFPGGNRQNMAEQEEILRFRFKGLPYVCFAVGFSISYLRRSTDHTERARNLFFEAWRTEYPLLLATLPTRWLISSLQTFMDHGLSADQRLIGASGYFFSNTLKAYEAERSLEGRAADEVYQFVRPETKNGFPGMDRFELGGTDLMVNTLALLLELSCAEPVSGGVLQELLARIRQADSIFSRMDQSRIHHNIEKPQFGNCWSFFEKPKKYK